jgi:hypothetical protein
MTRSEIEVLERIAQGAGRDVLPKSYFDSFPGQRTIAKNLMWAGLIESGGVVLTPAGEAVLARSPDN